MSERNLVQQLIDDFGKSHGFEKKHGTWYRRSAETTAILNLQKSQYSLRYYLNTGWWFVAISDEKFPKWHLAHIQDRVEGLVPTPEARLHDLLNLEVPIADYVRSTELTALLEDELDPVFAKFSTLEAWRTPQGEAIMRRSGVTGPAQELIRGGA
jgi:hypothetical protein